MADILNSNWSKDFVEHLRSVHFSLAALSVALVALALGLSKSEINLAHEQIRDIVDVSNNWDGHWLSSIESTVGGRASLEARLFGHDVGGIIEISLDPPIKQESFTSPKPIILDRIIIPASIIGPPSFVAPISTSNPSAASALRANANSPSDSNEALEDVFPLTSFRRPTSIVGFQRFWDAIQEEYVEVIPNSLHPKCVVAYWPIGEHQEDLDPLEQTVQVAKWTWRANAPILRDGMWKLGLDGPNELSPVQFSEHDKGKLKKLDINGSGYALEFFHDESEANYQIYFPINDSTISRIDAVSIFSRRHPSALWRHAKFADSFRELDSVSKAFAGGDLTTAERIIASEEKRSGEPFEAFGMKFPSELVTQLGILLLLGVELYFFVHLYQFRSRFVADDSGWEVAWIGVYDSVPARMLMFMSILILPNAAAALLGRRALLSASGAPIGWVQLTAFILLSGASTAAIWILLPSKRSAHPLTCDVAPDQVRSSFRGAEVAQEKNPGELGT